jgi:hypothetical protein
MLSGNRAPEFTDVLQLKASPNYLCSGAAFKKQRTTENEYF